METTFVLLLWFFSSTLAGPVAVEEPLEKHLEEVLDEQLEHINDVVDRLVVKISAMQGTEDDAEEFKKLRDDGMRKLGKEKDDEQNADLKTNPDAESVTSKTVEEKSDLPKDDIDKIFQINTADGGLIHVKNAIIDEGDIALTYSQSVAKKALNSPNVLFDTLMGVAKHWSKEGDHVKVPYKMDPAISGNREKRDAIKEAIRRFEDRTCIRWVEATGNEYYIKIINDQGCYSYIGNIKYQGDTDITRNGYQPLSIGDRCEETGVVIHEMMHALGFYHEQSRLDRDQYIDIIYENIMPGDVYKAQFDMALVGNIDSLGGDYDLDSVMHYGKNAFARRDRNGNYLTTIKRKDGEELVENRENFSDIDVAQINTRYKCNEKSKPPTEKPPTKKPLTEKPPTKKPLTEKPPTKKPPTEKPPTEKPPTKKPHTEKPPTKKPTIVSNKICVALRQLDLCAYPTVCNVCRTECKAKGTKEYGNIFLDAKKMFCKKKLKLKNCKAATATSKKAYNFARRWCLKTCFRVDYPIKEGAKCE